jgi:CRP-like cAMP-binding protein
MQLVAETARYRRGEIICHQGHAADFWYTVVRGVATRYVIRPDGRRQIIDLLLPGDIFGFTLWREHGSTSEAIAEETIVTRYPRCRTGQLLGSQSDVAQSVCEDVINALGRLEDHLLVMGRITACEKVGAFLIEIERRLAGQQAGIMLPISRYDIADYLAISVETVSRTLSDLRHRGLIQLTGPRAIKIVDREALEAGDGESSRTNPWRRAFQ